MTRGESQGSGTPEAGLAPVIPLFGDRSTESIPSTGRAERRGSPDQSVDASQSVPSEPEWRSTWDEDLPRPPARGAVADDFDADGDELPAEAVSVELAEKHLLKKLRVRSLSVTEARQALIVFGLDRADADYVLDAFVSRGYLDDAALAEQIVHVGLDRKGQGRRVIAQTLAKRGVPRDVADEALLALPDDDTERALEFARSKARSMSSLDRDTALRRLAGQLARRGYGGSSALDAARLALDEVQPRGPYFA